MHVRPRGRDVSHREWYDRSQSILLPWLIYFNIDCYWLSWGAHCDSRMRALMEPADPMVWALIPIEFSDEYWLRSIRPILMNWALIHFRNTDCKHRWNDSICSLMGSTIVISNMRDEIWARFHYPALILGFWSTTIRWLESLSDRRGQSENIIKRKSQLHLPHLPTKRPILHLWWLSNYISGCPFVFPLASLFISYTPNIKFITSKLCLKANYILYIVMTYFADSYRLYIILWLLFLFHVDII